MNGKTFVNACLKNSNSLKTSADIDKTLLVETSVYIWRRPKLITLAELQLGLYWRVARA